MNRTGSKRRSSCVDEEVRSNSVIREIKTLLTRPASLEIALYRMRAFRKKVCTSTVLSVLTHAKKEILFMSGTANWRTTGVKGLLEGSDERIEIRKMYHA
jgi:hypothetical protein